MAQYESTLSRDDAVDEVWRLAEDIGICMFVTWDGERQRARPLAARPDREEHRIEFLADEAGAKDDQIARFPKVTLAFADNRGHDYVTITGTARVSNDRARIAEVWSPMDKAWWEGAEDPSIRLITVEPEDAELWKGPNRAVAAAKLVSAAVGAGKPDLGQNRKVGNL